MSVGGAAAAAEDLRTAVPTEIKFAGVKKMWGPDGYNEADAAKPAVAAALPTVAQAAQVWLQCQHIELQIVSIFSVLQPRVTFLHSLPRSLVFPICPFLFVRHTIVFSALLSRALVFVCTCSSTTLPAASTFPRRRWWPPASPASRPPPPHRKRPTPRRHRRRSAKRWRPRSSRASAAACLAARVRVLARG